MNSSLQAQEPKSYGNMMDFPLDFLIMGSIVFAIMGGFATYGGFFLMEKGGWAAMTAFAGCAWLWGSVAWAVMAFCKFIDNIPLPIIHELDLRHNRR